MSKFIKSAATQSPLRAFVCELGYTEPIHLKSNIRLGLVAIVAAVGILFLANQVESDMAVFWVFGLAFGLALQRSRFCFASAFRDIFLLRHARTMKGVLVGLAAATVGFVVLMNTQVPNASLGILPREANVLPLGWHIVLGGLFFGTGMVVAGGCVSCWASWQQPLPGTGGGMSRLKMVRAPGCPQTSAMAARLLLPSWRS